MPTPVPLQAEAFENLRVIRALMEKQRVYRALSARGAALSGGLACLASICGRNLSPHQFLLLWLTVLALTATYNFLLLRRESGVDGPWVSDKMSTALRAIAPAMLVGAVTGFGFFHDQPDKAALAWILAYGLALHAMWSFAPRSIIRLGRLFLLLGLVAPFFLTSADSVPAASLLMGLSFGFLHLFYALAVTVRRTP